MLKEVLLWRSVTPLSKFSLLRLITSPWYLAGVSHRATKSDVYEGHFILDDHTEYVVCLSVYIRIIRLMCPFVDGFQGNAARP
jgi:hypothetical protein